MLRNAFALALITIALGTWVHATENYDFLKRFEPPRRWVPERDTRRFARTDDPLKIEMKGFYEALDQYSTIPIFIGGGAQIYNESWPTDLQKMLTASNTELSLGLKNLAVHGQVITFEDASGRSYEITVGHERNEYIAALNQYPVVIYLGHSRYGRGPAFEEMSNYFRLGDVYPVVEVDTRNRYFLDEPLVETAQFPAQSIALEGKNYSYQYVGEKSEESHLPADAYTKRIEGGPKDFNAADYLDDKQLIFLYSCNNVNYFKNPIRKRFTDPNQKLVFGTLQEASGALSAVNVFVVSLIRRLPTSFDVVSELDKVENLFTAY